MGNAYSRNKFMFDVLFFHLRLALARQSEKKLPWTTAACILCDKRLSKNNLFFLLAVVDETPLSNKAWQTWFAGPGNNRSALEQKIENAYNRHTQQSGAPPIKRDNKVWTVPRFSCILCIICCILSRIMCSWWKKGPLQISNINNV